jgi:hypothetical protein
LRNDSSGLVPSGREEIQPHMRLILFWSRSEECRVEDRIMFKVGRIVYATLPSQPSR